MTRAQKYIKKAQEIMPMWAGLQDVPESLDKWDHIDDHVFSNHGEYLGGMAAVITQILANEEKAK